MIRAERLTDYVLYGGSFGSVTATVAAALAAEEGLADTSGRYTVDTVAPYQFSGVAMEWTALPTGPVGLKLHGGAAAPCTPRLPIACCK